MEEQRRIAQENADRAYEEHQAYLSQMEKQQPDQHFEQVSGENAEDDMQVSAANEDSAADGSIGRKRRRANVDYAALAEQIFGDGGTNSSAANEVERTGVDAEVNSLEETNATT